MNWDRLYTEAYKQFDCEYISPDVCSARGIGMSQVRKRHQKKQRIGDTLNHFRNLMNSANPPRTKEEAVKALSPVVAYLLWSIFKMLVIQIIEWAWDQYTEQQRSATGERRDG